MYDSDELRALAKAALRGSLVSAEETLRREMTPETVLELLDEIERLREICAAVYQMAGAVNAPVRFLDALSDAANGEIGLRAPTDTLLPVDSSESGSFPAWSDAEVEAWKKDAERLDWLTRQIAGSTFRKPGIKYGDFSQLRSAIDAARTQGGDA